MDDKLWGVVNNDSYKHLRNHQEMFDNNQENEKL